jgi:hypothetical protein
MPAAQIKDPQAAASREMVQCARIGTPPLRFQGHCLAETSRRAPDGDLMFIALWQRLRGGFTLSFSAWTELGWRDDAMTVPSLEAAFDAAEAICAAQADALDTACEGADTLVEQIARLAAHRDVLDMYRDMIGEALDVWADLLPSATALATVQESA